MREKGTARAARSMMAVMLLLVACVTADLVVSAANAQVPAPARRQRAIPQSRRQWRPSTRHWPIPARRRLFAPTREREVRPVRPRQTRQLAPQVAIPSSASGSRWTSSGHSEAHRERSGRPPSRSVPNSSAPSRFCALATTCGRSGSSLPCRRFASRSNRLRSIRPSN